MRVLIVGGLSLLGRYLRSTAPESEALWATWRSQAPTTKQNVAWLSLELKNPQSIRTAVERSAPAWIIATAAQGDVDLAEADPADSVYRTNVLGTKVLIEAARKIHARVLYVSSNAVYRGDTPLYRETDLRKPVNAYGWYRMMSEDRVMDLDGWCIVRPILLYGSPEKGRRGNWVTRCLSRREDGKEITPVTDVMTQPLYAEDCARFIWHLISQGESGAWNIGGLDRVNYLEYTRAIADVWGEDPPWKIRPITSADLALPAPRPADTSYDLEKVRRSGFSVRGLREGLQAMKQESYVDAYS